MEEQPIGWRVFAFRNEVAVSLFKRKPLMEDFKNRDEAVRRKALLQAGGFVATVTPVYIRVATRNKRMKKAQIDPLGAFRAGWRLYQ